MRITKKLLNPILLSASVLLFSACAGGGAAVEEAQGPVEEVVQPGAVEAARDAAIAQEESNHKTRKDIFTAKTELGISTAEPEEAEEAAPAAK